jgi:hypothetical protein
MQKITVIIVKRFTDKTFYHPTDQGREKAILDRLKVL